MPYGLFHIELLKKVYQTLPENAEIFRNRICNACAKIIPLMIRRVKENFMRKIALCLEKNGNYIEHLL